MRTHKIDAYPERTVTASYRTAVFGAGREVCRQGADWYPNAHRVANRIASSAGIDTSAAAGIIAALSPRVAWEVNVRNARVFAHGGAVGYLGTQLRKADMIRSGVDPIDALTGVKERAFYLSIVNPIASTVACIDRHMLDAAYGDDAGKAARWVDGVERCQRATYSVASEVDRSVPETQAIIWIVQRGKAQ